MGWGRCGTDSRGRPIGYYYAARCDEPGCRAKIDRGLAYVCGGMHGGDENGCGEYFCSEHRFMASERVGSYGGELCRRCLLSFEARHRPRDARGRFTAEAAA
jgi:hypothetical protein